MMRKKKPEPKPSPQPTSQRAPEPEVQGSANVMTAEQIAGVLEEIAAFLEILGENPFKVRAYANAARLIPGLGDELPALIQNGELQKVRGIGGGIAERIEMLARTGRLDYHDELRAKIPPGLLEMLRIPGIGPKKAKLLFDTLDIGSVDSLEQACRDNKLLDIRGFGEKTQENILRGIDHARRAAARFFWSVAAAHALPAFEALRAHPAAQRAALAGSLRRRKEIVHDVDIVVSTRDPDAVSGAFATGPWVDRVLGSGPTKTSLLHPSGLQIDLRVVSDTQFPYALHHFTGSKAHNIAMRGRAVRMGIKINEYGLFRGTKLIPCADEGEIFAALGLQFVPPELREDTGEIDAAERHAIPGALIELGDLRGAFHVHTKYSDGRDTLADMVRAARALGWQYIGISDHSQSSSAYGMSPVKVGEQLEELKQLAATERGIRIFCGVESDILPDGSLDYPDEILRRFDFVIASVHTEFRLDRDTQTRRVLRALENPCTTILGHPTSRMFFEEPGMDLDLGAVFTAAARSGVAVEINGQPKRMDPDGDMIRQARDHGALFCVDPDAHGVRALGNVEYGVGLARRGWLEKRHVLNTQDVGNMAAHLQARRERMEGR